MSEPTSRTEPAQKPRYRTGGAVALLAIGLLFLIPSGLCTGIVGGGALLNALLYSHATRAQISMIFTAVLVGGPFIAAGFAMVWIGAKRLNRC